MKRRIAKVGLSLISLLVTVKICLSQGPTLFSNITIASPNAAALGKYGDYPVGYNTGIPQINIPLYSLKEGPLSVNVSVSYHAGGLKVMDLASSVGSGWALNAGGVITRSVVGAPDDRGHLTNTLFGHFSNYGYNSYLFILTGGATSPSCYDFPGSDSVLYDDYAFTLGQKDGEPDMFTFNFGNYSGKFYFRDDRTPVLVPEADFKIEPYLQTSADNIVGFRITTSDGTKYDFGKNQVADGNIDAIEKTAPYTSSAGLTSGDVNASWYLNKITSADNQFSIKFIYQAEQYSYYTISMFPVTTGDVLNKHTDLVKNYVDGVRLSQIVSSTGTINFLPGSMRQDLGEYNTKTMSDLVNTSSKTLGSIQITNGNGFCKGFDFSYSYFLDNVSSNALSAIATVTTDTKRLRLDAIQEKTCDNSVTNPPYTFTYTMPFGSFAPRRLTYAQDHWGFYNGQTTNQGLIPTYTVNDFTKYAGANRESSWPESSYGSLKQITYPTGGYTAFDFEANDMWFNYQYYSEQSRISVQAGQGIGNPGNKTITIATTTNSYKLTLDFHTNSGSQTTSSAQFAGMTVNRTNPHAEIIVQPGAGSQTYYLTDNSMSGQTGDWAQATIYEEVPTNYQDNKVVGGIRIKTIRNYPTGTASGDTTNYTYRSGVQSTGFLYSRPTYVQVLRNDLIQQAGYATASNPSPNGCLTGVGNTGIGYQKSPSSLRPLESVQGNHIGYNRVEVAQTGNGKNVYQYYGSDLWDQNLSNVAVTNVNTTACTLSIPNFPAAPLPFEYKRGELQFEGHYNEAGNQIQTKYYYPVYVQNAVTTPAYLLKQVDGQGIGALTLYNLTTSKKTKMTVVTYNYSPDGTYLVTTDSTFFESPYHSQPTRQKTITSKNEVLETKYTYAFDYVVPGCLAISDCYSAYQTSYSNALSAYNAALATCTSSGGCNCRWPALQSYRNKWRLARKTYVACRRANFYDPGNAYLMAHNSAKTAANSELKPILELQDQYMNLPIETTTWRNSKLVKAEFNRFDYAQNPATGMYPNKLREIPLLSPSTTFSAAAISGNALLTDSRYSDETTVKFDKGNLVEFTPRSGITTAYIYGYRNSHPVAKVVGATYSSVITSSGLSQSVLDNPSSDAAMRTELSKIRNAFPTAMVTTYTYTPLVGVISETSVTNYLSQYEYDTFWRLRLVRDKDNNILKKYCYNFQGQTENCSAGGVLGQAMGSGASSTPNSSVSLDGDGTLDSSTDVSCATAVCSREENKCINGICQSGYKVYTGSLYDEGNGKYTCTYHYEWSDGTWSQNYTEISNYPRSRN